MIGHFLLMLSPEQENDVLTSHMQGGHRRIRRQVGQTCLTESFDGYPVQVYRWPWHMFSPTEVSDDLFVTAAMQHSVPFRYDDLCERFGEARVNSAIRARILSNRARRLLAQAATQTCKARGGVRLMGAIGRWADRIHAATEDAILTGIMVPFTNDDGRDGRCINGHAWHVGHTEDAGAAWANWNALCMRFAGTYSHAERVGMLHYKYPPGHTNLKPTDYAGAARAAILLRNRILKTRAKRTLATVQPVLEEAACHS